MRERKSAMTGVLQGIRVLDLSQGIAGPIAGMLLADHGAAVTKIEPPGGDRFRSLPGSAVWLRGRRSVELDLAKAADAAVFHGMVRSADVVLESFAPGTAERLGAVAATLLELRPSLIHCSITGYGAHPAHRDRPAYDALVAARLGLLHEQRGHLGGPIGHINGDEPFLPDLPVPEGMTPGPPRPGPIFTHTPWPSLCAAYLATTGINAALLARERDGRGQHVQTSLLQAALTLTAGKWQKAENFRAAGYRTWIYDERAAKGFFRCSDGRWIETWVPNPRFILSSADGDTLELRRGSVHDSAERIAPDFENIVVLAHYWPAMKAAIARFPSDDWVRVAAHAGVPLQVVRTPEEALADPSLLAEGVVIDIEHPDHGRLRQMGMLYDLSATPGRVQGPVPRVGEHNDEVRAESAATATEPATTPAPLTGTGRPPLAGVTVLDLGFAVAGPFGTQVLADLGANVIKINATRDPHWHSTHIAYACNRGKRSICIDLKNPDGLAVFRRLVAGADVVHSNMRRDALKRLGCDEESLRPVNPAMIYCHTRGFDRGPRSDAPGNDQTGASLGGVNWEDGGCYDGGRPFWSPTSMGDTGNGFLSAIGVIQALYHRAQTGQGQSVDTSILNATLLSASAASVTQDGAPLPRPHLDRLQLGLGALYRLYEAADGWLCVAVTSEAEWQSLVGALSDLDLAADDRFSDAQRRAANDTELAALLGDVLKSRTCAEWFLVLDGAGVPVEIANESFGREVFGDPVMRDLGLIIEHQHPVLGRFEQFGTTIDFSATPSAPRLPPPVIGQHTRDILREHGFDDDRIGELFAAKVIFENLWVD
jgi:crotonobetainyl-CoA:carnitine CoA-transferase CaiB-like acyl-CoA transferase